MYPLVDRSRIYDLKSITQKIQPVGADIFTVGAGAGYFPLLNTNSEVI